MRRSLITTGCVLAMMIPAVSPKAGPPGGFNGTRSKAAVWLELEPLLIDPDGIHPLNPAYEDLVRVGEGGSFNAVVRLGKDGRSSLIYSLAFEPGEKDQIRLGLSRALHRDGKKVEELPELAHVMEPFDSWTVTVLEDEATRTRLRLRVVPIIRPVVETVPFSSDRLDMWLRGGPLIQFNAGAREDRVIFREVNGGGRALELGISGIGKIRLSLEKFPGSMACGSVRGHVLQFDLGGHEYRIYSEREILPPDPSRPGGGWTLYGSIDPSARIDGGNYYGAAPAP